MKASPSQWRSWAEMMKRVQAGDEEAYRTLLDEIGPLLYGYVRRRVFRKSLVDDVYQEVLFTFHRARHSYMTDRPFAPWLFTLAHHAFLDAIGRDRKFAERELQVESLPEAPAREKEDGELGDELQGALAQLPETLRVPVVMLKLEGRTAEEGAKSLGISLSAFKVRAHRGYARLKQILLKERLDR
ncbi:MAG TPA: RNA polymerase sigma factor [bacterium]|nr:RNA polymerase sigma factor [bacterium]